MRRHLIGSPPRLLHSPLTARVITGPMVALHSQCTLSHWHRWATVLLAGTPPPGVTLDRQRYTEHKQQRYEFPHHEAESLDSDG